MRCDGDGGELMRVSAEMKIRQFHFTLVMSLVAASISRSSEDRSAKPGRTCRAWSLSKAATGKRRNEHGLTQLIN